MVFYDKKVEEVLAQLRSSEEGLRESEVRKRQKQDGQNEIKIKAEPFWRKLIEPFVDVSVLILATAALISLWQNEVADFVIILVIILISAVIFYFQRFSTDRVLRSLMRSNVQKVDVLRGGESKRIDAAQLVLGDIVTLGEGEKVPADLRIMRSTNLRVDESQLTGESLPIIKSPETLSGKKLEVYQQANMLFQGSFVISGNGTGVVTAIGNNTEFGNLAMLAKRKPEQSPIQQRIDRLIMRLVALIGAVSLVVLGISLLRGMEILDSLRFVIAMAVSAVPEGLPIAILVILVLGMRRMAKKKALVRQMRAIETIGAISTIATDKTGTLTKNRLTVQDLWAFGTRREMMKGVAQAINHGDAKSHDPLDVAFSDFAKTPVKKRAEWELPFSHEAAMSAVVWAGDEKDYAIFVKGAPERVLERCALSKEQSALAEERLAEYAGKGWRVIALARVDTKKQIRETAELKNEKMQLLGLVAVADALRPEAIQAIRQARRMGISVRMVTGDHFETAYQIGRQLEMVSERDEVLDCGGLDEMSDRELEKVVERTIVFARVVPKQKYRLLKMLKKHNITAMTGDGVNDVPALRVAHVGIAMGSGSYIARDAGDIILLDDNFKTIVDAVREGRTIIANIQRMLFYLLATNIGEIMTMVGALLVSSRTPLEPVQILWVNLATDTALVIPLGLEREEEGALTAPPVKRNAPILSRVSVFRLFMNATTMALIALGVYSFFEYNFSHAYAQSLAFIALIVSQWSNALNARSESEPIWLRMRVKNRGIMVGLGVSVLLQLLVLFGPLKEPLHIESVSLEHGLVVAAIAFFVPIIVSELAKW